MIAHKACGAMAFALTFLLLLSEVEELGQAKK